MGGVELDHPLELDVAERDGDYGKARRAASAPGDYGTWKMTAESPLDDRIQFPGNVFAMTTTRPQPHSIGLKDQLRISRRIYRHERPHEHGGGKQS